MQETCFTVSEGECGSPKRSAVAERGDFVITCRLIYKKLTPKKAIVKNI